MAEITIENRCHAHSGLLLAGMATFDDRNIDPMKMSIGQRIKLFESNAANIENLSNSIRPQPQGSDTPFEFEPETSSKKKLSPDKFQFHDIARDLETERGSQRNSAVWPFNSHQKRPATNPHWNYQSSRSQSDLTPHFKEKLKIPECTPPYTGDYVIPPSLADLDADYRPTVTSMGDHSSPTKHSKVADRRSSLNSTDSDRNSELSGCSFTNAFSFFQNREKSTHDCLPSLTSPQRVTPSPHRAAPPLKLATTSSSFDNDIAKLMPNGSARLPDTISAPLDNVLLSTSFTSSTAPPMSSDMKWTVESSPAEKSHYITEVGSSTRKPKMGVATMFQNRTSPVVVGGRTNVGDLNVAEDEDDQGVDEPESIDSDDSETGVQHGSYSFAGTPPVDGVQADESQVDEVTAARDSDSALNSPLREYFTIEAAPKQRDEHVVDPVVVTISKLLEKDVEVRSDESEKSSSSEDGGYWDPSRGADYMYTASPMPGSDEDDVSEYAGGHVPVKGQRKIRFSTQPIRVYPTFSIEDYDRRNEDIDPLGASAEYELEKRIEQMTIHTISMVKGSDGLGLSIIGMGVGADSGIEKLGIFIKSINPTGSAAKDGRLRVLDMIIEVDGHTLVGVTQAEAAQILRNTSGAVNFVVGRSKNPAESEVAVLLRQQGCTLPESLQEPEDSAHGPSPSYTPSPPPDDVALPVADEGRSTDVTSFINSHIPQDVIQQDDFDVSCDLDNHQTEDGLSLQDEIEASLRAVSKTDSTMATYHDASPSSFPEPLAAATANDDMRGNGSRDSEQLRRANELLMSEVSKLKALNEAEKLNCENLLARMSEKEAVITALEKKYNKAKKLIREMQLKEDYLTRQVAESRQTLFNMVSTSDTTNRDRKFDNVINLDGLTETSLDDLDMSPMSEDMPFDVPSDGPHDAIDGLADLPSGKLLDVTVEKGKAELVKKSPQLPDNDDSSAKLISAASKVQDEDRLSPKGVRKDVYSWNNDQRPPNAGEIWIRPSDERQNIAESEIPILKTEHHPLQLTSPPLVKRVAATVSEPVFGGSKSFKYSFNPSSNPEALAGITTPIIEWSSEQVTNWLGNTGLDHLILAFQLKSVGGPQLLQMDSKDIKALEIPSSSDRKKLKKSLKELKLFYEREQKPQGKTTKSTKTKKK